MRTFSEDINIIISLHPYPVSILQGYTSHNLLCDCGHTYHVWEVHHSECRSQRPETQVAKSADTCTDYSVNFKLLLLSIWFLIEDNIMRFSWGSPGTKDLWLGVDWGCSLQRHVRRHWRLSGWSQRKCTWRHWQWTLAQESEEIDQSKRKKESYWTDDWFLVGVRIFSKLTFTFQKY